MKDAANSKVTLALCICGLAGTVLLSGCMVGEASYTPEEELQTQTSSLSDAMGAMDECRTVIQSFDPGDETNYEENLDQAREEFGECLDQNGVTPPIDPFRICDVVSDRVQHALDEHQVDCALPADILEQTLCDVQVYVGNCEDFTPPARCDDEGCTEPTPPADGPGSGTEFCDDVRMTVEDCEQREEPTTLPQQFPECFDGEGDGSHEFPSDGESGSGSDDGTTETGEGDGEDGGWGGNSDGDSGGWGDADGDGSRSSWGDDGATEDACEVLQDEIDNATDDATRESLETLKDRHCT